MSVYGHKRRVMVHIMKPGERIQDIDVWPGDRIVTQHGETYQMKSSGDYERCTDVVQPPSVTP